MKRKIVVLAGGTGGAKLAHGFYKESDRCFLTVITNPGDDIELFGLPVWPDFDTVVYMLSEHLDESKGWGVKNDTGYVINQLQKLGEETWFWLGDRDLATHMLRQRLRLLGKRRTDIAKVICERFGISCTIIPPSDQPVATRVHTDIGDLGMQEYYVRYKCQPHVEGVTFEGKAYASKEARQALGEADAIVIGPSNPFLSIGPILWVRPLMEILHKIKQKVWVVSPIIKNRSLKGPTADMFMQLGVEPSIYSLGALYMQIAENILIDTNDNDKAELLNKLGYKRVVCCDIVMKDVEDRQRFARNILGLLE